MDEFDAMASRAEAELRRLGISTPPDFEKLSKTRLIGLLEQVDQRFWPPRPTRQDKADIVDAFRRFWRHGDDAEKRAIRAALAQEAEHDRT